MKTKKQRGFTLIELVVVITILGILASIALPKFVALQAQARMAKMNGAAGSIKGAAAMGHGMLIVQGFAVDFTGTPVPNIIIEGTVASYVNGYPDASVIAALAGIFAPDYNVLTASGGQQIIQADGGHPSCRAVYSNAVAGFQPTYDVSGITEANCG